MNRVKPSNLVERDETDDEDLPEDPPEAPERPKVSSVEEILLSKPFREFLVLQMGEPDDDDLNYAITHALKQLRSITRLKAAAKVIDELIEDSLEAADKAAEAERKAGMSRSS